jgi:hypothetical protein
MKDNIVALSLSTNYVAHWTWKEAIREILQNAIDCGKWELNQTGDREVFISTYSGSIPRSALLLGESGKRDLDKIGTFGEGLKLALLILCREGYDVAVYSGTEKWIPFITHNESFGTDCLHIRIEDAPDERVDTVHVVINGLTEEQIDQIDDMYLHGYQYEEAILEVDGNYLFEAETVCGRLEYDLDLMADSEIPRRVYCGGLYVCDLPPGFHYSYNFRPDRIKLDRDRKTVQQWDITWEISRLLAEAGRSDLIVGLSDKKAKDIGNYCTVHTSVYGGGSRGKSKTEFKKELTDAAVESFVRRNGERAIPIDPDMDLEKRNILIKAAQKSGYAAVVVSSSEYEMVGGQFELPDEIHLPDEPDVLSLLQEWIDKHGEDVSTEAGDEIESIIEKISQWQMFKGE